MFLIFLFLCKKSLKQKRFVSYFLIHNQKRIVRSYLIVYFKREFYDEHDTKNYLINKQSVK